MTKKNIPPAVSPEKPYSFENFVLFLNTNFSLILIMLIIFLAGFVIGSLWKETQLGSVNKADNGAEEMVADDQPSADQLKQMPKVTNDDHQRGGKKAKVTIVEYSDYQCPFCNRFHPTMKQVLTDYGDDVAWVYRHFPLDSLHPNARKTAELSECVAKYGNAEKFWQFSDAIYEKIVTDETITEPANAMALAVSLGVNQAKLQKCLDDGEMTAKVKEMETGGQTAGISGTPGSILVTADGEYELIPGALPIDSLKIMIDKYLK